MLKNPIKLHDENAFYIANTLAKIGGIAMVFIAFLAIFNINILFLSTKAANNLIFLILIILLGGLILAIEFDWEDLPTQYKLPFKSHKIRGIIYIVIGIFCILEGIGPILVIISGFIYNLYDTQNRDIIKKIF